MAADDPRDVNCRGFAVDGMGRVVGVLLTVISMPGTRYVLESVRLLSEMEAQGRNVAYVEVYDRFGERICGDQAVLSWPWAGRVEDLDNVGRPGARCSPFEHPIVNPYNPHRGEQGPLAIYVADGEGGILSDVVGGLGLPLGRHVGYRLVFRERLEDLPGSSQDPEPPLGPELDLPGLDVATVVRVAARAAGEAEVLGPAGVRAVAATIWNRLASGRYPNTLEGVLDAYYAPDVELVQVWHVEAALDGYQAAELDGMYYALSRDDLFRLGVDPEEADYAVTRGRYGVYLFRDWPGR